ncbi:polysaccharide deacetylase family protein [Sphingomicrobium sp. XHP0235]|uniref:polysaccharide deacetylase family protein n=1 Tax=Sphingomicrobium aquimarinum TaxID=3133971 RepID=UPI0031FEDD66
MDRARARVAAVRAAIVIGVVAALAFGFRELVSARCFALTGELVCSGPADERRVALSFDDGPTARGIEQVLPALEQAGVSATFFLEGEAVAERPELVAKIVAAGHEVGNHSWSHDAMIGVGAADYEAELRRTDAAIVAAGAPRPRYFRPPYGKKFIGLGRAVDANAQRMILWNVEEPSASRGVDAYVDGIMEQVEPGAILLVHPMFASREVERAALPILLRRLAKEGYAVGTVGDLLGSGENEQ